MKHIKKLLAVSIVLALLISMLAMPGWAETATVVASGYCGGEGDGTNLTWELTEDGVLTISGEGAMADSWESPDYAPWYACRKAIKSVIIGDSVTTIGDHAFYECTSLTSVTSPNSVTTIGSGAFRDCDSLAEVHLGDSVITIESGAFYSCDSLTTVDIGDGVTIIGDWAFAYCYNLAMVDIGDSVTGFGDQAFLKCHRLTAVEIPASVTFISGGTFQECTSLTEVRFVGDAPAFVVDVFAYVTATAYYPAGNETWTEDVMQDYGGDITWVAGEARETILIGNTATTTGAFASIGVPFNAGLEAALKAYNDAGGFGEKGLKIEFLHYNDTYDSALGLTYTKQLVEQDNIFALVGHFTNNTVHATLDYIKSIGIPTTYLATISNDLYAEALTGKDACYFPVQPTYEGEGRVLFARAVAPTDGNYGLGGTKIGVVATTDDFGSGMLAGIRRQASECNIPVVSVEVDFAATDYTAAVSVLKKQGCDVVILAMSLAPLETAMNAMRDIAYNAKVITSQSNATEALLGLLVDSGSITADRPVYITSWMDFTPEQSNADYLEFATAMQAWENETDATNTYVLNSYAMSGYVAGQLFIHGLEQVEALGLELTWENYIAALESEPFHIPMGGEIDYSGGDRLGVTAMALQTISLEVDADTGCYEMLPFAPNTSLAEIWASVTGDAPAVIASGYCGGEGDGTNLTWTLTEDGVLTISGEGAMADWASSPFLPWYSYRSSIRTVVIEDSVTTIGDKAFYDCTSLTTVTIPDSVTTIGDYAFFSCTRLTEVAIPDSVTTIGGTVFGFCTGLTAITVDENNPNYSNDSFGVLFNKDKTILIQAPVAIRDVYPIPATVTTIGDYAFYYCNGLASVSIGDSVTTIGNGAFYWCINLAGIRFEGDAPTFGQDVFEDVATTAYYPAGNDTWTDEVMQDYGGDITWVPVDADGKSVIASGYCGGEEDGTNLSWELTGDGTLTISGAGVMADYAYGGAPWYSYCSIIKSVVIGASVTTIGDYAFYYCFSLASVTIPTSVTTIGDYAFQLCRSFASVTIPDSVTTIGESAFSDCYNLTTVTIPDSVTTIGDFAFDSCHSLTAIAVDENNPNYSSDSFGVLFNKNKTTLILAPYAITGAYTVPDSVTTIWDSAFTFSSLSSIRFTGDAPEFVIYRDWGVFGWVTATAYYPANNDTWTEVVANWWDGDLTWVPFDTAAIQCDVSTDTETSVTILYDPDVAETITAFLVIYDTEGRFVRTETVTEQSSADGIITLSISCTEEEYAEIGRIAAFVMDGDTMVPLCGSWESTRN